MGATSGVELADAAPSCALRFNVLCAMDGVVVAAVGVGAEAGVGAFAGPALGVAGGGGGCPATGVLFCFDAASLIKDPVGVEAEAGICAAEERGVPG